MVDKIRDQSEAYEYFNKVLFIGEHNLSGGQFTEKLIKYTNCKSTADKLNSTSQYKNYKLVIENKKETGIHLFNFKLSEQKDNKRIIEAIQVNMKQVVYFIDRVNYKDSIKTVKHFLGLVKSNPEFLSIPSIVIYNKSLDDRIESNGGTFLVNEDRRIQDSHMLENKETQNVSHDLKLNSQASKDKNLTTSENSDDSLRHMPYNQILDSRKSSNFTLDIQKTAFEKIEVDTSAPSEVQQILDISNSAYLELDDVFHFTENILNSIFKEAIRLDSKRSDSRKSQCKNFRLIKELRPLTSFKGKKSSDYSYKLLVLGDSLVGKTTFFDRFFSNTFSYETFKSIGQESQITKAKIGNDVLYLQLFDSPGQSHLRQMPRSMFNTANAIILMYDVSDKKTFENIISSWFNDIVAEADSRRLILYLVGNKIDLDSKEHLVSREKANQLINSPEIKQHKLNRIRYFETSSLMNIGITDLIENMSLDLYALTNKLRKARENRGQCGENCSKSKCAIY